MSKEEVKELIKKKDVAFIQCWFTDILGCSKSFTITPNELDEALEEGMGFDGSSINGFTRIEESDMIAKPDPKTFKIIPWKNFEAKTAMMFCDILNPDGSPYAGCPRYILKKELARASELGYTYYVGPELEYFYFRSNTSPETIDKAGYFDGLPTDLGEELREKTVKTLQEMGIIVEYSHHEVAPSQHEIDLRYDEALAMADKVMIYKTVVKEIARQHDLFASFMPKPIFGENGSGMHTHQSLFKGERNAFYEASDKYNLSVTARHYIAGLLNHAPALTAICNQWVNSYKRLVPGYEAPVYAAWARRNRSSLIRVPMYKPGKEKATRIELRSPDPGANPYLAFAVMLSSGLDGIEKKMAFSEPVEENIFEMSAKRKSELGIISLPGSLLEAIELFKKDEVLKNTLGEHTCTHFLRNKEREWDKYRTHVSRFEIEEYLPLL